MYGDIAQKTGMGVENEKEKAQKVTFSAKNYQFGS